MSEQIVFRLIRVLKHHSRAMIIISGFELIGSIELLDSSFARLVSRSDNLPVDLLAGTRLSELEKVIRALPAGYYNNWNYPGNVNPHTGRVAPGNPDRASRPGNRPNSIPRRYRDYDD